MGKTYSKEKHGVCDPMPELTVTLPYVNSNACNMGIGQPYARVDFRPPVWDLGFGPALHNLYITFIFQMAKWMETDPVGTVTWSLLGKWGRFLQSKDKKKCQTHLQNNQNSKDLCS